METPRPTESEIVDISTWVLQPPADPLKAEKYRPPDAVLDALKAAGYEGEVFVQVRPQTDQQLDELAVGLFAYFDGSYRGEDRRMTQLDLPAFRNRLFETAVLDAEFPKRDDAGRFHRFRWKDHTAQKRAEAVRQMGKALWDWWWETISRVSGAAEWLSTENKPEAEELAETGE